MEWSVESIVMIAGALGGIEGIKWLVGLWLNRRTHARKECAAADSMENENERRQVDWLEERLAQRDAKIDALYAELRGEQKDKMEWIHRYHELELQSREDKLLRCEVHKCSNREPQSGY